MRTLNLARTLVAERTSVNLRNPLTRLSLVGVLPLLVLLAVVPLFAACGNGPGAAATPVERGRGYYLRSCAMCHGHSGEGRAAMGNALAANEFIASSTDEELIEMIKEGRSPSHPLNESGRIMPPKGGDPRLTDENLHEIVTFLRTL